jgi:gas vesicle protein
MSNPDVIRADIERTREELGQDVDALADKVTPGKIVDRQKSRLRRRFADVRERVMGTAGGVGHSTADAVSAAGDAVAELPHKARQTTQGAPLAVGAVVAGIGFVAALLIPASDRERRMASSLKDQAQPLLDKAGDTAREVAGNLKQPAKEAVDQVKAAAADSAATVKDEVQATADQVKQDVSPNGGSAPAGSGSTGQDGWTGARV